MHLAVKAAAVKVSMAKHDFMCFETHLPFGSMSSNDTCMRVFACERMQICLQHMTNAVVPTAVAS